MAAKFDAFSVRLPNETPSRLDELTRATKPSRAVLVQEAIKS
jgi:predicted transcriptional regulator